MAKQCSALYVFRMANARAKAEQADQAAQKSREDSNIARIKATEFAPEFVQPGKMRLELLKLHGDKSVSYESTINVIRHCSVAQS